MSPYTGTALSQPAIIGAKTLLVCYAKHNYSTTLHIPLEESSILAFRRPLLIYLHVSTKDCGRNCVEHP